MCGRKNYIKKSIHKWDRETCWMTTLVNSEALNTANSWLEIKRKKKDWVSWAEASARHKVWLESESFSLLRLLTQRKLTGHSLSFGVVEFHPH